MIFQDFHILEFSRKKIQDFQGAGTLSDKSLQSAGKKKQRKADTRVRDVAGVGSWTPDAHGGVVRDTGNHVGKSRVPVNAVDGARVSVETD